MHSQIVSASYGIPCFGFAWDKKIEEFFNKLGLPSNYSSKEINLSEIQNVIDSVPLAQMKINVHKQAEESRLCLLKMISEALPPQ